MSDQSALVTLVTPIFNRANTLEATASSVLDQINPRWKWIVVDDGSSDETWMKLQALQRKDKNCSIEAERSPKGHAHAATLESKRHPPVGCFS